MRQAVYNQTAGRNSGQNKAPSFNGFPQFPQNMVYPPYFLHLTCGFYCNISGLFCKHGKENCLCQVFVGTFFIFRNSVEKLCVSWALPFVECVAVWALKLPVPHTDVLKTHSSQSFSTELLESKGTDNEHLLQTRESKKLASNTSYKVKVSLAI